MSDYYPDNWVVLKIQQENETLYKVLAGWSGGYLDGDSWRMNSGIVDVEEDEDFWKFYGSSGSVYKCPRESYRLSMATSSVYNKLEKHFSHIVELMPEDTNWREVKW